MRRRTTRSMLVFVLLGLMLVGGVAALDAAARQAANVDYATVGAGSLERVDRSGTIRLPFRADLLGATWHGEAEGVELRAQGADGRWSRWVALEASADGPDRGSTEARSSARALKGRRGTSNPIWVGDAIRVQVRSHEGQAARAVELVAINATATATAAERRIGSLRRSASWVLGAVEGSAQAMPAAPAIQTRKTWGAEPPQADPWYAEETGVLGAVVHHTDGTNRYACSQVPAILRGIQRYHMRTNGWNDIGYNFLVDACGTTWEGRAGGTTRPVGGAHTMGFNTSTTGIALIGNHVGVRPSARARTALQKLLAWRLDIAHVKPNGRMALVARTSDRFPAGSRVVVRAVSGHRDLFPTSCPGAMGYRELDSLARAAWVAGGAKVANITRSYALRNPGDPLDPSVSSVVVRAVASHADMQLMIRLTRASTGEQLHSASVTGGVISTVWTPAAEARVPAWDVRIRVDGTRASQRARPATVPLLWTPPDPGFVVTVPPNATVAPGGDPVDDQLRLKYTLASEYRLGATLHDPATGTLVATLMAPAYVGTPTEPAEFVLDIPAKVAEGTYELRVGLAADPAAGRSLRRYTVTLDR